MSKLSTKLKQAHKNYHVCRMAFFHLAFLFQEEVESEGKIFAEESRKLIPSFPLMDYLKFKPLIKILPERYILKLHDDGAAKLNYYSTRPWFTEACEEVVKKKAYSYQNIDAICSGYVKENRGTSRARKPSRTDTGLRKQLGNKQVRIAELEHEIKILRAENKKLKAENAKLKALGKKRKETRNRFAKVSVR